MATQTPVSYDLKLGSKVRIKDYSGPLAKIIELRGPLGPNGMQIYRVAIPQKLGFSLVEVRGDQLEVVRVPPRRFAAFKLGKLARKKKPRRHSSV